MIDLDHRLIYDACRLITGENVHWMKELIFAYEQAVSLHNTCWSVHNIETYDPTAEMALRWYVLKQGIAEFKSRVADAKGCFNAIQSLFDDVVLKIEKTTEKV